VRGPDLGDRARVPRDLLLELCQFGFERTLTIRHVQARGSQSVQGLLEGGLDDRHTHDVLLDRGQHLGLCISTGATSRFAHTAFPRSRGSCTGRPVDDRGA
jgi:hypothetical protein